MFLCVYAMFLYHKTRPSVKPNKNLLSSDQWIFLHVLRFQSFTFPNGPFDDKIDSIRRLITLHDIDLLN